VNEKKREEIKIKESGHKPGNKSPCTRRSSGNLIEMASEEGREESYLRCEKYDYNT